MIETIRKVVRQELSRLVFGDVGEVVAVDWKEQRARVRLVSSEQETGWLAIGTGFASGGDGSVAPLAAGDRVWCVFADARAGAWGVILGRVYGANAVPDIPEGAWGVGRGTRKVIFDGDGKVAAEVAQVDVTATGEVSIDGSVVKLGGGAASAVRFEQLEMALNALVATVAAHTHMLILAAPATPTGPMLPPPTLVLAPARALKVKVT